MTIFNIYSSQLGESQFNAMAQAIGGTPEQTLVGSSQIVPLYVSALARITSTSAGAEGFASQLDRDHDGSILMKLPALYANPNLANGDALVTAMLGNRRADAAAWVSEESKLSPAAAAKLMAITASILLGMIGMRKRQGNFSPQLIAQTLDGFAKLHEREENEEEAPAAAAAADTGAGGGLLGGFFGKIPGLGGLANLGSLSGVLKGGNLAGIGKMVTGLLDKNKDGSLMDDLMGMAGGFMGKK